MERFAYPVIDAQAHIGRFPGHCFFRHSAAELVACMEREGVRFALTSSASATTVGQAYGHAELFAAAAQHPGRPRSDHGRQRRPHLPAPAVRRGRWTC